MIKKAYACISQGVYPPEPGHIRPRWHRFKNIDESKLERILCALACKRNKVLPGAGVDLYDETLGVELAYIHGAYVDHSGEEHETFCSYTIHKETLDRLRKK
jgi:hypothetical protein